MQKGETGKRSQVNAVQDNFIRSRHFFGAAVKLKVRAWKTFLGAYSLRPRIRTDLRFHRVVRDASTESCFNERAGGYGVLRFTSQFYVQSKSIQIRIGGQTAWEAVRTDFIENKEIASKEYELQGRCAPGRLLLEMRILYQNSGQVGINFCQTVITETDFKNTSKEPMKMDWNGETQRR